MEYAKINWPRFEAYNPNLTDSFESLSRIIFKSRFLPEGTLLHSNPNNPGIEVEPAIEKNTEKRVSFQSKYFTSRVDYDQIKKSAEKIIKYYNGQIDKVYLFSNKTINTASQQYQGIQKMLADYGIELVLFVDKEILDMVLETPMLQAAFFCHTAFSYDWFRKQVSSALTDLGRRYNKRFNIDTSVSEELDFFARSANAVKQMNDRKKDAIDQIKKEKWQYGCFKSAADRALQAICDLPDITQETVLDCLEWEEIIEHVIQQEITEANRERDDLAKNSGDTENRERMIALESFLDIPSLISLSGRERCLLTQKALIVSGEAGTGKSHLFASMANSACERGNSSVLLLGHKFIESTPLEIQIMKQLGENISFSEFLDSLEVMGDRNGRVIVIYVDAMNESSVREIWKNDLEKLFFEVEQRKWVKIAVSYRKGYESLVFGEPIFERIRNRDTLNIEHRGFADNSFQAINEFLNHEGVPFSPEYYLQYEMTNPLFLTMFCEVYDGSIVDINSLIDRILDKANKEVSNTLGFDCDSFSIVEKLLNAISALRIEQNRHGIPVETVFNLPFWKTFGLSGQKIQVIYVLKNLGLIVDFASEDQEYLAIGYNLIEDFLCARNLLMQCSSKEQGRESIRAIIIDQEDEKVTNLYNQGIFSAACGLFAGKYGEECSDIIEEIKNKFEKQYLRKAYIKGFAWRSASSIDSSTFINYVNQINAEPSDVFPVLLECATKTEHPLNANFLHNLLMRKELAERDYIWTVYINSTNEDSNRVVSLALFLLEGRNVQISKIETIKLLSIVMIWHLTSSNRWIRDTISHALVELLKSHIALVKDIVRMFEGVNDVYVTQRIYGLAFGACVRGRPSKEEFFELAKLIYDSVFDMEYVLPDIIARDYASLIIERYLYEYPIDNTIFDIQKVQPPYNSEQIPKVEKRELFTERDGAIGFEAIELSMTPNVAECGIGMYGDFGRYVFQNAIDCFEDISEADVENLYYYALRYICDELGYENNLFSSYDTFYYSRSMDRSRTRKTERIGKKYQWIALFHILAKLSDSHRMRYNPNKGALYSGPWDLYIRDYDPTLNRHNRLTPEVPNIAKPLDESIADFINPTEDKSEIERWTRSGGPFQLMLQDRLLLNDQHGAEWVALNHYYNIDSQKDFWENTISGPKSGGQRLWVRADAFFVRAEGLSSIVGSLTSANLKDVSFPSLSAHQLYYHELFWAPGYNISNDKEEQHVIEDIRTTRQNNATEAGRNERALIKEDGTIDLSPLLDFYNNIECEEHERDLGLVMPAYCTYNWESEYDCSFEESTAFNVPCKALMDHLHLVKGEEGGCYFNGDDLAAIDGSVRELPYELIIRKDYLDHFLSEKNLALIWVCIGEKQYFMQGFHQIWANWSGVLYLDKTEIKGVFIPDDNSPE